MPIRVPIAARGSSAFSPVVGPCSERVGEEGCTGAPPARRAAGARLERVGRVVGAVVHGGGAPSPSGGESVRRSVAPESGFDGALLCEFDGDDVTLFLKEQSIGLR